MRAESPNCSFGAYHLRLLTHPLCCFCTPAPPRRESGIVDFVLHSYKDFTVRWYLYHREGVFPSALQRCCVASGICAAFLFCAFSEERATYTMMLCSRGYNFTVKIGWCNALHRGRLTLCLDFARQLFEGLTVGDSSMLLAISKAKFELKYISVIIKDFATTHRIGCREIKLPLICPLVLWTPNG